MKNFTISKVIFLFSVIFANLMNGQKLGSNKILFDKAYTINELKNMNGVIRCASTSYEKYLQDTDPKRMTEAQFEAWIQPLIANAKTNKSVNNGIIIIPVVVHVIHNGQPYGVAENITDEQVQSQITVMNNDFRRVAGTPGFNTNPVGADVLIQFALAKVDPNGNPTSGIDRVNMCRTFWTMASTDNVVKPLTIWNPTQYMNMWSVKLGGVDAGTLGYAEFPTGSGLSGLNFAPPAANTDGVVANFATFGSTDYGNFPMTNDYDKGRTMTHEVGHFLGLRHIWGDDNNPAVCATDYCDDTTPAHVANFDCLTPRASCTAGLSEMLENYMDYTNDVCMNLFTINQKERMLAVMNNSPRRVELKTSNKDVAIPLFANDAEIILERVCEGMSSTCTTGQNSVKLSLYNRGTANLTSAVITYSVGSATGSFNWSGNLAQGKYANIDLLIPVTIPSGTMTVSVNTANGVADQRTTNNSKSLSYVSPVASPANVGAYTFTLQNDFWASETSWDLKDSSGTIVYQSVPYTDVPNLSTTTPLPTPIVQTWNLTTGCYTFTIRDIYGDGMYDYGNYNLKNASGTIIFEGSPFNYNQTRAINVTVLATGEIKVDNFAVYPNPANEVLNITKVSNKAKFEIYNAVGQLVKSGDISNNQVRVAELVKGVYMITIKDKNISENIKFIKK